MPASVRRLLLPLGLCVLAATGVTACGAGPRAASGSTVDTVVLDRGAVVGVKGDQSSGVRALVARPSRKLSDLQTDFHSSLFGDGGKTKITGYLNGLLPDPGPETEHKPGEPARYYATAYPGDRVGFLVRDAADTAPSPSAVVGLFPAPFTTRFTVKRRQLPIRIQCADVKSKACEAVQATFTTMGLASSTSNLEDAANIDVQRIYVGPWAALRPAFARGRLSNGLRIEGTAEANGYGAQISANGQQLRAGAKFGEAAEGGTYATGAGLIFAFRDVQGTPDWVVTGADEPGVERAAAGLTEDALAGRVAAIFPPAGAGS